jgi:hypothetical protein
MFHLYATSVGKCATGSYVEFYVYVKSLEQEKAQATERSIIVLGTIGVDVFLPFGIEADSTMASGFVLRGAGFGQPGG